MKKNEKIKDLYDVEKFKEAYQKSKLYLDAQQQFVNFEKHIKKQIQDYEEKIKAEYQLSALTKKVEKLDRQVEKNGSIDKAYEMYYDGKFSLEHIENMLKTKKEYVDAHNKLKETTQKIKNLTADFKKNLLENSKEQYEKLKEDVIKKGMDSICFDPINWVSHKSDYEKDYYPYTFEKKDIEKFKNCILKNQFYCSDYCDDNDYIGQYQYFRIWFDDLEPKTPVKFDGKKIVDGLPSPFEFYVSRLNKHFGKDLKRITIVTNDFSEDYWDRDDVTDDADWGDHYFVYVATLLVPKEIAEQLMQTETKQTKKSIEKLVKMNPDIYVLNEQDYEYGRTDYKPKWTEELREKIRKELNQSKTEKITKKTNEFPFCELFNYFDDGDGYHYYGETPIVKIPDPKTANAIFETLEYVNKLYKISKLKKNKDRKQELEQAEKEYAETERQINELFVGNSNDSSVDLSPLADDGYER